MPSRVVSHAVPCMLGVFVCFKLRAGLEKNFSESNESCGNNVGILNFIIRLIIAKTTLCIKQEGWADL